MSAYTENLPDLTDGFCVLDLETTGLSPAVDHIIEIALVVHCNGRVSAWSCLVDSVEEVPPDSTAVHGITSEMLKEDGLAPEQAYRELFQCAEFQKLPVIGHNIFGFDHLFLTQPAVSLSLEVQGFPLADYSRGLDRNKMVDTGALYKGITLGIEPLPSEKHYQWAARVMDVRSSLRWNLAQAASAFGIEPGPAALHRAANDARLCHDLLLAILKKEGVRYA